MVNIETHCHSHHSFDCNTSIESIAESCEKRNIKGIVICDHDVCEITPEEENVFSNKGIKLFKAIEFTTQTDAHIIGVSSRIAELQQPRFYYDVNTLVEKLQDLGATVIIPHPNHATGIVGNGKISDADIDKTFKAAHFVEKDNFRYGKSQWAQVEIYPHLKWVIGSDAHSAKNVGSFVNQVTEIKSDLLATMQSSSIQYVRNEKHGRVYWLMKSVKRSAPYQFLLKLFPPELRRNIKNKIINR